MNPKKWPKIFPPLTPEQEMINNDFVKHWHGVLAQSKRYSFIEKFNHGYVIKRAPTNFLHTLEIGAGLGEHLEYEKLNLQQQQNYIALELRQNMADKIQLRHPNIKTHLGDCQQPLPFPGDHFDRILAIHVLEHLPNLPAAIKEMYRLCNKKSGVFSIVIPCEGGLVYKLARRVSAQRIFEDRYKQSYKWFIEREHVNKPDEIISELEEYFYIDHRQFFPIPLPIINLNLCIGLTLRPHQHRSK